MTGGPNRKPSAADEVREMYDATADGYEKMMDAEIDLPVYADTLGRLRDRLADLAGTLIDTACGSGHMLSRYHERYDPNRQLMGTDLSPQMVAITQKKLGSTAQVLVSDMRDLGEVEDDSAAALLNFFALHHLGPDEVRAALDEWHRVLVGGGQLVLGVWEGSGLIDYGDEADIVAFRYQSDEIEVWVQEAGFSVTRCVVEPVEDFPMDAIYLEAVKK